MSLIWGYPPVNYPPETVPNKLLQPYQALNPDPGTPCAVRQTPNIISTLNPKPPNISGPVTKIRRLLSTSDSPCKEELAKACSWDVRTSLN